MSVVIPRTQKTAVGVGSAKMLILKVDTLVIVSPDISEMIAKKTIPAIQTHVSTMVCVFLVMTQNVKDQLNVIVNVDGTERPVKYMTHVMIIPAFTEALVQLVKIM